MKAILTITYLCCLSSLGGLLSGVNAFQHTRRRPNNTNNYLTSTLLFLQASVDEVKSEIIKDTNNSNNYIDALVVGGGPAGLLSAIMYAKTFPDQKVKVYDRLSAPPNPNDSSVWSDVAKFYLIGLGSRGQKALSYYNVWEDVEKVCTAVPGRMDWAPGAAEDEGVERIFTDRPYMTQVLPRDKLVGVLHDHILTNYGERIELNYGYEVTPVSFGRSEEDPVIVSVAKCDELLLEDRVNPTSVNSNKNKGEEKEDVFCDVDNAYFINTNMLIAADGTGRTVANEMEKIDYTERKSMNMFQRLLAGKPFKVTRYEDDNQRVYKTIPIKMPSEWRGDLNYSARTQDGRVNFDALPADRNGNYCGVLLLKKGDEFAQGDVDPVRFRELMDEVLPQFSKLIDNGTVEQVARKSPSFLPSFRYVGPRLHQGERTIILGDCAHTVKPYFGLGANSALEDVKVLGQLLEKDGNVGNAVKQFTKERAKESEVLVKLSRSFDRPGKLGFVTFVLPLILDSIFHKIAPAVFGPNSIAMLQREGVDFRGVRRKKRIDRLMQVTVLSTVFTGLGVASKSIVKLIARVTGRSNSVVVGSLIGASVGAVLLKKMAYFLNPRLSPADVLTKTNAIGKKK